MKHRVNIACVVVQMLAVMSGELVAADKPARTDVASLVFRRWAVLASPAARDAGVSDLLVAELAKRKVELVEREQWDAIAREVELTKLFGADGAAQRLDVGQRLKADALVLLSLVEHDQKKFVKLVISDCRYGSRLRLDHFPFAADGVERLVQDVVGSVEETRKRFARGVERIVAVSPFLSKNLTHEFDHLQFGFAALLGQGFSERSGVAVLEIEEARAIGEELSRANAELKQRLTPLFVEGEFEVLPAVRREPNGDATEKAPQQLPDERTRPIRYSLRVLDGRAERAAISHTAENFLAATTWLSGPLAQQVLGPAEIRAGNRPLTSQQQRDLLFQRAKSFSQVANFAQSTALREAALLLDTDDWEQRLLLVGDYHRWQQMRSREITDPAMNSLRDKPEVRELWQKELWSRVSIVSRHTELVFARGVLNPPEAWTVLERSLEAWNPVLNYPGVVVDARGDYADFFWRCLQRVSRSDVKIREGGMHPTVARVCGITSPVDRAAVFSQDAHWASAALHTVEMTLPRHFDGRSQRFVDGNTPANLDRFVADILPETRIVPSLLSRLMTNSQGMTPYLVASGRVSEKQMLELFERWQSRRKPLLDFYARFSRLGLKAAGVSAAPATADDLAESRKLDEFLEAIREVVLSSVARPLVGRRV